MFVEIFFFSKNPSCGFFCVRMRVFLSDCISCVFLNTAGKSHLNLEKPQEDYEKYTDVSQQGGPLDILSIPRFLILFDFLCA